MQESRTSGRESQPCVVVRPAADAQTNARGPFEPPQTTAARPNDKGSRMTRVPYDHENYFVGMSKFAESLPPSGTVYFSFDFMGSL